MGRCANSMDQHVYKSVNEILLPFTYPALSTGLVVSGHGL